MGMNPYFTVKRIVFYLTMVTGWLKPGPERKHQPFIAGKLFLNSFAFILCLRIRF